MVYSTNLLTSVAQCDTYLSEISTDLGDLGIRRGDLQTSVDTNATLASTLPIQLQQVETALLAKQAELAATTDESDARSLEIAINSLENKKLRLLNRQANLAGLTLIDKQLALAGLDAKVAVLIEFKTAVETRKTEIQNSGTV